MTHLNPRIDCVVAVADAVRDDLRGLRADPEHVVTIYKGHDLRWYTDTPADLSEFGIPDGAFVVGAVANYRPRKGIEVLIEATHHLPPHAPIHVLLVGADMDKPELKTLIDDSPMCRRIHAVGFRADACALIAACQASVLASTKREGLPKTVIEAMVYGVPTVVSDTGGSAELVVDGETGFVLPPGDAVALARALRYLCEHPAEAEAMGCHGRERIDRHFNIRDTIAKTLNLYHSLVE